MIREANSGCEIVDFRIRGGQVYRLSDYERLLFRHPAPRKIYSQCGANTCRWLYYTPRGVTGSMFWRRYHSINNGGSKE